MLKVRILFIFAFLMLLQSCNNGSPVFDGENDFVEESASTNPLAGCELRCEKKPTAFGYDQWISAYKNGEKIEFDDEACYDECAFKLYVATHFASMACVKDYTVEEINNALIVLVR